MSLKHWEAIAAGLNPESRVNDLVFDPTNPQVVYMADAFSGVYRSTDGGSSWAGISNGLRTRAVNELAISADGLHLYAATEGEGVFRLDLAGEPPAGTVTTPDEPASGDTSPQPAEESPEEPEQANDERGGICGGAIALPLAVVGLAWASNPRRKAS